ncbi:response regulator [Candidatus Nitronereus thalassa]|uniref:Response regulator n=1 Tax=Candidatus Nitronereus thalassa TaxID=3020898 RepID=A0ABU3K8Z5_9BACT|nr:response regulator [Candidatus Nitronereus thalassa]MDT7042788.1 response regulator [Candidatus Nitronereus thalassa]
MESAQASGQKEGGYQSAAHAHRTSVKNILVVEDESSIASALWELLQDWGCEVVTASNGREGLDRLRTEHVDGIVLDLDMPMMDGATMLDELRWRGDHTPVIVMSGGADVHRLRMMQNEGAQGFLVKPFTLETLHAECERCFVPDKNRESLEWGGAPKVRMGIRQQEVA